MDFLFKSLSDAQVIYFETQASDWMFVVSFGLLAMEVAKRLLAKSTMKNFFGDGLANFSTFVVYVLVYYIGLASVYIAFYYAVSSYFAIFTIPTTIWSVALCVVLADLAYYWEHRFTHVTGIGWATHTVHHSSPYFNISVAYRFGPLDGLIPIPFHLPLVILGFNPVLVFVSEALVQIYQTPIHTELVRKFPKPIEAVFNTPSHHRVHHGTNPQYIDKNYGGILIVWDKLFGTFEPEREKVVYGIATPLDSVNPLVVFFHGFSRLFARLKSADNVSEFFGYLFRPPGWTPDTKAQSSGK